MIFLEFTCYKSLLNIQTNKLFYIDFSKFYYIINTVTVVTVMGLNNPHSCPNRQRIQTQNSGVGWSLNILNK